MHTILLLDKLKGREHLEDLRIDGKMILEWVLSDLGGKAWSGCI
jgi:hypothetical protein